MKKFIVRVAILMAGLVGISVVNNVILLRINPLEFYYTPAGLIVTTIVNSIEMIVLIPIILWYVRKFLVETIETEEP